MENAIIFKLLNSLRLSKKPAYIIKRNGYFLVGLIVAVDPNHVLIEDRKDGNTIVAVSEISEVREWRETA